MRVNVKEEGKDQVLWYKVSSSSDWLLSILTPMQERFLSDDEIIEHVVVRKPSRYTSFQSA